MYKAKKKDNGPCLANFKDINGPGNNCDIKQSTISDGGSRAGTRQKRRKVSLVFTFQPAKEFLSAYKSLRIVGLRERHFVT
jgi:hypothetical protein